ncbi:MAG: polyphosphate polymerase domain-containing protein [Firmicutes bacterium]|nr:polyphosphate polymerase domain-containing protein [Bacillota bacterium]
MQYKGHNLRHELKYNISYADYHELRNRALVFMHHDSHGDNGKYFIRSLYFDDIMLSNYNQKMDGWEHRRKYRIRTYDFSPDVIKFEIKDKFDSYISKVSSPITYEQCMSMLNGNFGFISSLLHNRSNDSSIKALKIGYIDNACKILRPQVVVDYTREVFICEEGNVRLTFDMNLRAGLASGDIFDPDLPTVPAYDDDSLIMEVKYDDFIPNYVKQMLRSVSRWQTAQSKYTTCCLAQSHYFGKDVF